MTNAVSRKYQNKARCYAEIYEIINIGGDNYSDDDEFFHKFGVCGGYDYGYAP